MTKTNGFDASQPSTNIAFGQLIKHYGDSRKNVGEQIQRSLDSIRQKFAFQVGRQPGLALEYLIYCPDHAVRQLKAAALDTERIVDAPRREQLAERIQVILPPGPASGDAWAQQVAAFFRQTFEVVADVHAYIGAQETRYTRLSHGLLDVLRGVESTALKACARVGNHTLRRFTNDYDLLGNQIYSDGQILFDTVRRFKGQQAAAVILVDVDPRETDLQRELQVLFCGLTRATVHLDVVCAERNPVVRERILPLA